MESSDYQNRFKNETALLATEPSLNGHEEAVVTTASPLVAYVDVERGMFVTSRGNEIELSGKPISSFMLERFVNEDKPRIPMKEVVLLGKHKQMEATPNDPAYLALLAEWEARQNIAVMIYLFTVGVKGKPSDEFIEEYRVLFPDAKDTLMKYLWVCSQMPDDDANLLREAIMGKTLPTTEGLNEAANFTESK